MADNHALRIEQAFQLRTGEQKIGVGKDIEGGGW
jgi:hypothetical protein